MVLNYSPCMAPKIRLVNKCLKKHQHEKFKNHIEDDFYQWCKTKKFYIYNNCPKIDDMVEIFDTKFKGKGVRTKELIINGTHIGCYGGDIVFTKSTKTFTYNFSYLYKGLCIDGSKNNTIMSYVNHSDNPNCIVKNSLHKCNIDEIHLVFVANKDINKGEEITIDYGDEYWQYMNKIGIFKYQNQKLITDYFPKYLSDK